jgi:hypothetical protein
MIDNFNQIRNLLQFNSPNDFYYVQIIRRKKENPEMKDKNNSYSRCIKSYYINSIEKFDTKKDEITKLCEVFNARAYIKLNYCDAEKIALQMLRQISEDVINKCVMHSMSCYDSCCGKYSGYDKDRKYWIIDLDGEECNCIDEIITIVNKECEPLDKSQKVIDKIPTKNGIHLLTKPFNIATLHDKTGIGRDRIKKEALTLLYCI